MSASPPSFAPIAIVGAACRFPGARSCGELWSSARAGLCHIAAPPAGRWSVETPYRGGFLDDVYRFDAESFGIADIDAGALDPQQRLLLTLAREALAGSANVDTRDVGVFVGAGQLAYFETILGELGAGVPKETLPGNLLSMLATRIAHALDLHGPAFTIDSACSASLVALHQACRALHARECEAAVVGGVNLNLTPTVHRLFETAGALSPTGRLLPFSKEGDGTVPADGGGILVLEPLERARALGHRVWAIILGSAINNCGRTIGVMAPKPEAQIAVMQTALRQAGVASHEVAFVEAHATGTSLGDAVERRSIEAVYTHAPRLGAVKGIIGHCLGASGIAGVIRTLGELTRGELGAVNAFGFGGTNAHVVLRAEDVPEGTTTTSTPGRVYELGRARDATLDRLLDEWVHRVTRRDDGAPDFAPLPQGDDPLPRKGSVVITGASGGIGRVLARFLARNYRARLVLVGRRELDEDLRAHLGELERLGAKAAYVSADLSRPADAERVLDHVRRHLERVDVLFHAAGVVGDAAMEAKRAGLLHLEPLQPALTVLFSSISALIPGLDRGLEAYAAANRWLDDHARERAASGRRIVSIAWCPWEEVGMAAAVAAAYRERGIAPIAPELAMAAMVRAVAAGEPYVAVMHRGSASLATQESAAAPAASIDWREALRALISDNTGIPLERIGDDDHLTALGIDSLTAVELVKELDELAGRRLPTTFLFEHDTVAKLAAALENMGGERAAPKAPTPASRPARHDLELVDAQRTFLVQQQYFPHLPCNVFLGCTLSSTRTPPLDRAQLERALALLVERHPVLRSAVARSDGKWVQRLGQRAPAVEWLDALDEEQIANTPFELERGPLLRVVTDGRRLVINGHHLLIDAWSAKLIVEELLALHEALLRGEAPSGAAQQTDWWTASPLLRPAAAGDGAAWWQQRLDAIPPLHLPWDGDPSAPPAGPARTVRTELDPEHTARLHELARREAVSMPALVLASYLRLLFEISGQHDLTVRVAHARRDERLEGITRIVGSFADSLPVRVTLRANESVGALARRVQEELVEVRRNAGASSLALARLAERSGAGPAGLTPAGFSFLNLEATPSIGALRLSQVHGASASGFTRLGLIGWTFDGRLTLSYNFLASHFAMATVGQLAAQHRRILEGWAAPRVEIEAPRRLDARLLSACARFSERRVLGELGYAQLGRAARALASELDGERVAVLAEPGPEALVGVIGAMCSGAAYVPLDPAWPDKRLEAILAEAQPSSLVVPRALAARAQRLLGEGRRVHVDVEELATRPESAIADSRPAAHAYVMFTSGSTGRPKGVCVGHDAVLVFLEWVQRLLRVSEDDRFLQTSSLGFGGSIRQMFSPILAGARIVPVDAAAKKDPESILRLIEDQRITIYNSVPSMWSFLMDALERRGVSTAIASLRWVLLGGEAVPAAYVRRWRQLVHGGPRLANLYGSTETVVNATWFEVTRDVDDGDSLTPIGWPRYGCRTIVRDAADGVGELVIEGAIADGYLGGTSFTDVAGADRAYPTGDLVRRSLNGALVYVGRGDSQVQIYGNRVELGEIEAALCGYPGVGAALVRFEDGRLRATLEVREGAPPAPEDVRAFVAERLPSYMVPHDVHTEHRLQRTPSGKTERRAPAEPSTPHTTPAAGVDELARRIGRVWQALLELDATPGPQADFFTLGGDSMLAIEMVTRLHEELGRRVSPLLVHRHRRLGELAAALAQTAVEEPAAPRAPVVAGREYPLGAVQRGFWLASLQDEDTGPIWTVSIPLRGPLDLKAFQAAVRWVQDRHPILRATFTGPTSRPSQRLGAAPYAQVQFEDLEPLGAEARRRALEVRKEEERAVRLSLGTGPLLRFKLCRLAADEHVLLVSAHHIVIDAHSTWVLLDELLEQHDRAAAGRALAEPIPEHGYVETIGAEPRAPDPFWERAFDGLGEPPPALSGHGHHATISLAGAAYERLRTAAARRGTSPFAMVFEAYARALLDVLGVDDLVVATAVSGREHGLERWADAVGPFAYGIPVRARRGAEEIAASLRDALSHADTALASLPARLGADGVARLGRFFLSWLAPAASGERDHGLVPAWPQAELRFRTESTATEISVAALVRDGLHLYVRGGERVAAVAAALERHLEAATRGHSALVFYAPADVRPPVRTPLAVETVTTAWGSTELILLPLNEADLRDGARLRGALREALDSSAADTIALAGMLPSLTGLGREKLCRRDVVLTTGHAATVVAMYETVEEALAVTKRRWTELRVGALGFGAIGQATLQLCVARLGQPRAVHVADPRFGSRADAVLDCDLILAATSVGRVLDVSSLRPGTLVIDDSFPRAFDDAAAWKRMEEQRDVLLVGGGMFDVGELRRESPFPEAAAARAKLPVRWLPGCHAEALLVATRPELGPTIGEVSLERAHRVLAATRALGWRAAPLHLGPREVPEAWAAAAGARGR